VNPQPCPRKPEPGAEHLLDWLKRDPAAMRSQKTKIKSNKVIIHGRRCGILPPSPHQHTAEALSRPDLGALASSMLVKGKGTRALEARAWQVRGVGRVDPTRNGLGGIRGLGHRPVAETPQAMRVSMVGLNFFFSIG